MLLEVKNLKTEFALEHKNIIAVNNISFGIKEGEILCVVGESGSGKSALSLSIMGLIEKPGKITNGEIIFNQKNILALSQKEKRSIRGKDIAMIFQEPMTSLNPSYSVGYQVDEVLKIHFKNLSAKERKQRVIELFELVKIPFAKDKYNEYPFRLSGGQIQRVMIAMAMACKPKLLIADEPTTALDVTIQAQILALMKELLEINQTSIMFITHDLGVVAQIAHRVIVMYKGHIVEQANTKEIFKNPKHPYTKALLRSNPSNRSGKRKSKLATIDDDIDYLSFTKEIR